MAEENTRGIVFDIKRYSIHDGPGIRTTFFLKGCPLSCWWCHNPEGISPLPVVIHHPGRCIGCGRCVAACTSGAWEWSDGRPVLDRGKCALTGACARACPSSAIEIAGKEMSVEEVLREARKDIPFFDESGGGVTFSGGEPFLQAEFLIACLRRLHREEIHIAVDTSGFCKEEDLLEAARYTDLFLFDIKVIDPKKHEYYTGVNNFTILSNLRKLDEFLYIRQKGQINLRFPLIPGVNDNHENVTATADLAASLKSISGVNVLPYHSTGEGKYKNLGKKYKMEKVLPPDDRKVNITVKMFSDRNIETLKGG